MEPEEQKLRVYEQLFKTWRSQVDSYWQRSNYFAAFETVAIAGCWHILNVEPRQQRWAGSTMSLLGIALTIVWLFNNHKTHGYVLYWWEKLKDVEKKAGMTTMQVDFVTQHPGGCGPPYRYLLQAVPVIFLTAWLTLFVWSLLLSCACSGR